MQNLSIQRKSANQQDGRSLIERSVSFLLLGLICIFALNSIGNVQAYVHQYHHHWTGDILGIAFGTVVFVCAYVAATTSGQTRVVAIVIGTIFGVASAYFQTELYISEGMRANTAYALSYIPILAGEVGLALLESLYSRQRQRAGVNVAKGLASQPASLPAPVFHRPPLTVQELPTANGLATNGTSQRTGDLVVANQVRMALKQERKAAIPPLLAEAGRALSTSELVKALQAKYDWAVSSDTVRGYCQELVAEQVLESTGRKWQHCTG